MARLQILQLPEGAGDERPPFVLVVDQYQPLRYVAGIGQEEQVVDEFEGLAEKIGARGVIVFWEPVEIPANETPPVATNPAEGDDQTAALIHAHEQSRLALCGALLLSLGSTWEQITKAAAEGQRELADFYRKLDEVADALGLVLGSGPAKDWDDIRAAVAGLRKERDEARQWARHGYEIGQRHCGWTDHGVAPAWLTDGWPPHIDSCEHLKQAAEFDEALTRVRNLSTEPEAMNAQQEHPSIWRHGYHCGVLAAKSATRPRNDPAHGG